MGFTKKETVVENVEEEVKEEEVKEETTENEVVEVKGSVQDVLDNDPVLKRICQSGYFMMRQHSDIIDSKKFERLEAAKKIHNELMATYPETKYIDKSTKMIESIDKEITTFAKNITVQ